MASYLFDWASAGTNGTYTLGTGADALGVSVATDTNAAGETGSVLTPGGAGSTGLFVSNLTDAVTTTMNFDAPVQNLSFEVFDIDQSAGAWDDKITIIALDAAGNQVAVNYTNLDGLHSVTGDTLNADGSSSVATEYSGAPDSVTVDIPGPIVSLSFVFNHGESALESSKFGISNMSFASAPASAPLLDEVVEGTAGDDVIDETYTGDPEGDMVDHGDNAAGNDDDVIEAYGGNDKVFAGLGNDIVYGGDGNDFISGGMGDDTLYGDAGDDTINGDEGNDTIFGGAGADHSEMGTGNDTFYGGAGDDWVNGDYGNDVLHGGTGNDFLRGSYGNDTIYSGGAGEGDDYLWGGYNDDTFIIENGFGNDSISGEDQAEVNGDTLDLTRVTDDLTIDLTAVNPGAGTFTDGTYTADYNGIENILLGAGKDTLVLADFGGADRVEQFEAPTDNGDGTFTGNDQLDVSALTRDYGTTPVTTEDVVVSDDGSGNALLTFPGGESILLIGVAPSAVSSPAALEAMGIPPAPDGIVSGTAGDDNISFGYIDADGDVVDNGDARLPGEVGDDDIIEAGAGNDTINAGFGNDEVFAGDGDDVVEGWTGDDEIHGGLGNDTLHGQDGNDSVFGDSGADTLTGGEGDDALYGGDGDDTLDGETGADTLDGGAGADTMTGGADQDTFVNVTAGDVIDGSETGIDHDVINMAGAGPYHVNYDPLNSENGTIDFLDADGNVTGTLTFTNIEEIVPCFTPGSLIATDRGARPVEALREGDRVITRDRGYQEIRWIGARQVDRSWMARAPHLAPVLIRAGALGEGIPARDMMVSPNHRMLMVDSGNWSLFGEREVLAAAKHLVGRPGIERAVVAQIGYIHLMFDRHEVISADNCWSESFQPGDYVMEGMDEAQRAEIYQLFPELEGRVSTGNFDVARPVVKKHEAALIGR